MISIKYLVYQSIESIPVRLFLSHTNFKVSSYKMDDAVKEKIYKKWKFTFEEFGYEK